MPKNTADIRIISSPEETLLKLRYCLLRQRLRRIPHILKVVTGRHTLTDAMHDLAMVRVTDSMRDLIRRAEELHAAIRRGDNTRAEALRVVFLAEHAALVQRINTNDFYQDTNSLLGWRIRFPRKEGV